MSNRRRRTAAHRREVRAYDRRMIDAGDRRVRWTRPLDTSYLAGFNWERTASGLIISGSGHYKVLMPGDEVTVRGWHGEVIFSQKAPDWLMNLGDYARYITSRPRPLSVGQRGKIRR